jgi:hypothetical protein
MQMSQIKIFFGIIIFLVLGTIITVFVRSSSGAVVSGKYDGFTQCLKDKGAVFYGAFWCSHCQAQKKVFGSSAHLLPYVECSTADASGQLKICADKKIQSYPTWMLADGTIIPDDSPNGAGVKLETLAAKTGCVLPQ